MSGYGFEIHIEKNKIFLKLFCEIWMLMSQDMCNVKLGNSYFAILNSETYIFLKS